MRLALVVSIFVAGVAAAYRRWQPAALRPSPRRVAPIFKSCTSAIARRVRADALTSFEDARPWLRSSTARHGETIPP